MFLHPGTTDATGMGWIVLLDKERVRILGRDGAGAWIGERIDAKGAPRVVVPADLPQLVRLIRVLQAGRKA